MNAPDNTATLNHDSKTRQPTLSQQLSNFAHGLTYDDIPAGVRERARYLILDAVGVALASTTYEFARAKFAMRSCIWINSRRVNLRMSWRHLLIRRNSKQFNSLGTHRSTVCDLYER